MTSYDAEQRFSGGVGATPEAGDPVAVLRDRLHRDMFDPRLDPFWRTYAFCLLIRLEGFDVQGWG